MKGGTTSYFITAFRRIISEVVSGGERKSSSREVTRERSNSTLLLTVRVSYSGAGQCEIQNRESWANFIIRVDNRYSFKEGFKRVESGVVLLEVSASDGSP